MSTPWSWSGGSGRQADKGGWSWKVTEMGQGTDKDEKGKKGGRTMTDHKNLSYFREAHKLNCHQARWSLYLSRFDFILTHKPGRQMGRPDALSRWADHLRGADDNTDFTLLTLEVFELRATEAITLEGEEAIFMERI